MTAYILKLNSIVECQKKTHFHLACVPIHSSAAVYSYTFPLVNQFIPSIEISELIK